MDNPKRKVFCEYVFETTQRNGRIKLLVNGSYKPKITFEVGERYLVRNRTGKVLVLHFKRKETEDVWYLTEDNFVSTYRRLRGRYYIDGIRKSGTKIRKPSRQVELDENWMEPSGVGVPSFIKKWYEKRKANKENKTPDKHKVSDDEKKLIEMGKKYGVTPNTGRSEAFKIARKVSWKDAKEMAKLGIKNYLSKKSKSKMPRLMYNNEYLK